MDICGYIYLYDSVTNRQDIMKISAYNCKNILMIDSDVMMAEFIVDKNTLKIVSDNPDFSFISYSMLMEIASTAVEFDKHTEYPSYAEFNLDYLGNPDIKFCNTSKEIFPVPFKMDVYLKTKLYLNITEKLTGSYVCSVLKSSLYAHHLNFLSLREGIVSDRLFSCACGRIFLNASHICNSIEGMDIIKRLVPEKHFEQLIKMMCKLPVHSKIKRYNVNLDGIIENSEYENPYHRIISTAVKSLPDDNVFSVVDNPGFLSDIINAESEGFSSYFENLVWQSVVGKIDDFEFATCDDLLSITPFRYGRDMLKNHIVNNRKFYNYHKKKENILALKSNGSIFLINLYNQ